MGKVKMITAEEAVKLVKDGQTLALGGFAGFGAPEALYTAIEERFLNTGSPRNLKIINCAGLGDKANRGANHFGHEGFVKKVICGHIGLAPKLGKLVTENKVECYMIPQGVVVQLMRATAGKKLGVFTHVGLGTYADPRMEGCRANDISKDQVVKLLNIDGKEVLFYPALPVDVAMIRATTADEFGNLTMEHEAVFIEQISMAQNAKNHGGIVIAQVERIAQHGTLNPQQVKVPGTFVDYVVVAPPEHHCQSFLDEKYHPEWTGELKIPTGSIEYLPMNERKVIARRAAMELRPNCLVNLGIGVCEGTANVAAEEGVADLMTLTIESGTYSGVPAGGLAIGASANADAVIDQAWQFDFYDGGGVDLCFLGLAETDGKGNVNVSKFGGRVVGPGGFINISQNAKAVIYCGTFTAGGLKIKTGDGKLTILQDGRNIKFKNQVEQITFSGDYAAQVGQKAMYITERAVFVLTKDGMMLTEIAPGVDLQKDILDKMEFKPIVSKELKLMDEKIFKDELMHLVIE